MIKGKTKSGFQFEYDERILTDWRFVSAVAKSTADNDVQKMLGITEIANLLVVDMDALIEHLKKDNDGFAPSEKVMLELTEIMNASKTAKN
jgi:hypothetical protein